MKTKTMVGAGTALLMVSGFAATEFFSGTGSWMDPTAWDAGKLPDATNTVQVAGGAQLTFAGDAAATQSVARLELGYQKDATDAARLDLRSGALKPNYFFMGTASNAAAVVVQTGGTLATATKADPEFSIGYTGGGHGRYEISGGELNLVQTGHVGTYGNGELVQNGGKVTGGGWFITGRMAGSTGYYEVNAGTASFTAWGLIVGEYGEGTVKVSGPAEVEAKRLSINGKSKLEIANGGKVSVDYVEKQNTTTGSNGQLLLDGGTLVARASAKNDPFITGIDHLYVGDDGATLEIPEGVRAAVRVPFTAAPDATAGDLVKKGDGVAYLFNEQALKGKLRVEDGYLALVGLGTLPSFGADKLSVSPGASVIVDGRLEDADFNQLLANVSASTDAGLGIDSVSTSITNANDIVLNGNAEFSKTGAGILSLTGDNAWGGFTRIWAGTLDAKRGEGLPVDSAIRYSGAGGVWAPREDVTLSVGTGAGEISADGNTPLFGFATVAGDEDISVAIGSADTAFVAGTEPLAARTLQLDAAANTTLTFENPITVTSGNFTVNTPGAGRTALNGELMPQGGNTRLYKTGNGHLTLAGEVVKSATPNYLYLELNAGTVDIAAATTTYDIIASSGATLWLTNNTATTLAAGWFYAGNSGANATVNMANGTLATKNDCRFMVGNGVGSAGTFNLSGGTVSTGYFAVGGSKGRGTVNQTGGDIEANKESYIGQYTAPAKGEALSGESVYNLSSGTLTYKGNFQVGVRSNGRLEQSGGAVVETSGWTSLGRWEGASGVINMTGGTYDSKTYGVIVGEIGNGTINIRGDAKMTVNNLFIGGNTATVAYNANGTVSVTEGGTLKANAIIHGWSTNNPSLYVNGGTLGVCAETGAVYDWMCGLAGNFDVGPAGVTLDTGAVDVYTDGLGLGGATTGTIVKKGTGALNLGALPEAAKVKVAEGTLGLRGAAKASQLVHRWSFNGTLEDGVGENDAALYTPKGTVTASGGTPPALSGAVPVYTADGKAVSLTGGKDKDMIGLGADILPKSGPVTIEIWTTLRSHQNWEKMLGIGLHQNECFLLTFSDGGSSSGQGTSVAFNHIGANVPNTTGTGFFKDGNPYYYVFRFTPVEGGTLLSAFSVDVLTGKRLGSFTKKIAGSLSDLNQAGAWLGWAWWNDPVPNADFDEVRVWNAALSESEMLAHVRKGPDEVFAAEGMPTVAEDNVYPESPSEELLANNYLVHRWTFNNTMYDAVGGKLATAKGVSQIPGQLSCVGGGKGASYIELGSNILPTSGPVTIEIWSTVRTLTTWTKQFVLGNNNANFVVTTYSTSKANGPSSFGFAANGYNSGNVQGAGTFPLNVPCCTMVTFTPRVNGGTRAEMRVWNAATGERVGGVGTFEGNFTLANLVQNVARLNTATGFWGDVDENASYDEVRIWNAALGENQQRINVQLGADRLPRLVPGALIGGEAAELEIASGAVVDLQGGEVAQYAVSGEGTVRNGTLVVDGVLLPGGDAQAGTLTLEAGARVTGTVRLDVGDKLVCAGALDLSAATIEVANPETLNGAWTFATSSAEGITGRPASNLKGTGYRLSISAGAAKIVPEGVVIFIR